MIKTCLAAATMLAIALPAFAGEIATSVDPASLSKTRQTPLGLYVASADADKALQAAPGIVFIDVRSVPEFYFVGHANSADQNIPFRFISSEYNAEKSAYGWTDNRNFVAEVGALMAREGKGKDDPVFLMCRSGGRSVAAVRVLAEAGYTQVWSVIDGFEGGKDESGHRTNAGWRNENLPWTYRITADQHYAPAH